MKKLTPQSVIGQLGVNFVEQIVLSMKYAWRPTPGLDVGIDGEIEICDPVTGAATNSYIKVQVKSTSGPFQAETNDSFEYSCEQNDINYWMQGNAPVILIVCRPSTNEAYWVSIKDYFKDPDIQKLRKVVFNKHKDRFSENISSVLNTMALPPDAGIYFTPLNISESLYTNLLKVSTFSPDIYVAETQYRSVPAVWDELNKRSSKTGSEWILKNKMMVSFHPLNEFPFDQICDPGTCERFDSDEWADSKDEDRKRDFVHLLNMSLRQRARLNGLHYHKEYGIYYYPANRQMKTVHIRYQSLSVNTSREVFKQYQSKKDPTRNTYCRHSAFKGYFFQLGNGWFLEITPTYHFTRNGRDDYLYREELIKGIKRLERNPAIVGQLLMWVDVLKKPTQNLFNNQEYPFLSFGDLEKVDLDVGIPDDKWYDAEEDLEKRTLSEIENQPRILGI